MKLAILSCVGVLFVSSVATADVRLQLNAGQQTLRECGGTIEATVRGTSPNINLVLRNVKSCSNFAIEGADKVYKVPGPDGRRGGSFSIPVDRLHDGSNRLRLTVRSNSGKTRDAVSVAVRVAR